jgi:hypothetical protein
VLDVGQGDAGLGAGHQRKVEKIGRLVGDVLLAFSIGELSSLPRSLVKRTTAHAHAHGVRTSSSSLALRRVGSSKRRLV